MEPLAWEAGNYVAEGQWGVFSPLTILIGVLATMVPDVVVFVTVVKIGLIVLGGTGTYLVARSYAAREPFAVVAGLVVGLSSWSVFVDWPSWVNGQMGVALLPWAWWFTRRAMAGRNPVGALVLCYLVVSVGYVYCAMYVAVILLGCLVDAMLSRSRRELLTVLALGIFSGLVTVAVYLPGVLTAPVTGRNTWAIVWRGRLTMSLPDFFVSMLPTPRRHYVAWLLPVVLWLDLGRLRRSSRDLVGVCVSTVVLALWVLGPSAIGPLRWPERTLPALMVPLVVLLAVVASRSLTDAGRPPSPRPVAGLGVRRRVRRRGRDPRQGWSRRLPARRLVVVALGMTAWSLGIAAPERPPAWSLVSTLAFLGLQFAVNPQPTAADRNMPAAATQYDGRITSRPVTSWCSGTPGPESSATPPSPTSCSSVRRGT